MKLTSVCLKATRVSNIIFVVLMSHPIPAPPPAAAATTPRAGGALALRPQTAPSASTKFDKRRHQAFVKQLQSTLLAARLETPPVGVKRDEVERRISILERMIEDVGKMSLEAAAQQEATYNARYVTAERNRLRKEDIIAKSNHSSEKRHLENFENHREEEALLLRHRRRTNDHRTHKCHEMLEDKAIEQFQRGVSATRAREERLRELSEKRDAAVANHIKACREREAHCQDVLINKGARDAAEYQSKVDAADAHRKHAEARLKHLMDNRTRSASARAKKVMDTAERGKSARVSVDLHHGLAPKLDVSSKPFEVRLAESNAKELRRSQRYDEEHRVRHEYAHFKTIRFEDRRVQVQHRLDTISAEHLRRGEEIRESALKKLGVGDAVQAKRRAEHDVAAEQKARDVQQHIERAEKIESDRIDSIRRKRYNRWSGRQDAMAELVFSEYLALADDAVTRDRHHANTKAGGGEDAPVLAIQHNDDDQMSHSRKVSLAIQPPTSSSKHPAQTISPRRIPTSTKSIAQSPVRGIATSATLSANRRHETISEAFSQK